MAQVRTWIAGFLKRHKARFGPNDWPDGGDPEDNREFVKLWVTAFATREVTEAEADEASRLLAPTPPNFRREHIPAVVAKVEEIRRAKGGGLTSGTREAAREASKGCVHCGGEGLAGIWALAPDDSRRIPRTAAAYCVCAHGRWIKRRHAEQDVRRLIEFGDVLEGNIPGWSDWPPDVPRIGQATDAVAPSRAEINAMFRPAGARA